MLAVASCVDPRRSASRLSVRSDRSSVQDAPRPARGTERHAAAATVPGIPEEEFLARTGQRRKGARRTAPPKQRRVRHHGDVVSVLSRTVREVEAAVRRGPVTPAVRTQFQAVAMLLRDERARVQAAPGNGSHRAEQLKRLYGIAAILAATAVRDGGVLALLAEGVSVSDAARSFKREMMRDLGIGLAPEETASPKTG